jgi:hypothetical protein
MTHTVQLFAGPAFTTTGDPWYVTLVILIIAAFVLLAYVLFFVVCYRLLRFAMHKEKKTNELFFSILSGKDNEKTSSKKPESTRKTFLYLAGLCIDVAISAGLISGVFWFMFKDTQINDVMISIALSVAVLCLGVRSISKLAAGNTIGEKILRQKTTPKKEIRSILLLESLIVLFIIFFVFNATNMGLL